MPFYTIGCATGENVSRFTKFHIFVEQLAPVSPMHTATSHRTNFLFPSRHFAGSDILVYRREAAAGEL